MDRLNKTYSLPFEWLHILADEKPLATYAELKEMSCSEVYDLLETQNALTLHREVRDYITENRGK